MSVNKIGASWQAIVEACKALRTRRWLLVGAIRAWHHMVDARAFIYLAFHGARRSGGGYDSRERWQSP